MKWGPIVFQHCIVGNVGVVGNVGFTDVILTPEPEFWEREFYVSLGWTFFMF